MFLQLPPVLPCRLEEVGFTLDRQTCSTAESFPNQKGLEPISSRRALGCGVLMQNNGVAHRTTGHFISATQVTCLFAMRFFHVY